MRTPGELLAYFESLAADHIDINDFINGDFEEILASERSKINYPALWVETPEIPMEGSFDSFTQRFEGSFTVFMASAPDMEDKKRSNSERSFLIARDIIFKMMQDKSLGIYDFEISSIRLEPVISYNNDNEQGWRVDYIIQHQPAECYNSNRWSSIFPEGSFARFTFEPSGSDMVFTNTSDQSGSGFTIDWIYYIDDMTTEHTGSGNQLTISDAFNHLYVEMRLNYGGATKLASIYLKSSGSGSSIPFSYNPLND